MDNIILLRFSLILIVVLCTVTAYGLYLLWKRTGEWRYESLCLIPLIFDAVYIYVGLIEPPDWIVRWLVRTALIFSLCVATHVIFTLLARLKREMDGKQK